MIDETDPDQPFIPADSAARPNAAQPGYRDPGHAPDQDDDQDDSPRDVLEEEDESSPLTKPDQPGRAAGADEPAPE